MNQGSDFWSTGMTAKNIPRNTIFVIGRRCDLLALALFESREGRHRRFEAAPIVRLVWRGHAARHPLQNRYLFHSLLLPSKQANREPRGTARERRECLHSAQ